MGLMPILTSFDLSRSNQQLYRVSRRQCHDRIYLPRASEQARSGFAQPVRSSVQPAPAVSGFLRRRLSAKPAARTAAGVGSPRRRGAGAVGAGHLGDLKRDRVGALGALASAEAASGSRRRAYLRGPVGGTHRSLGPEPPEPHGAQVSLAAQVGRPGRPGSPCAQPRAPPPPCGRPPSPGCGDAAAGVLGSGRCPGGGATPRRGLGPRGRWGGRSGRLAETRPLAGRRPGGAAVCSCPARPWNPRLRPLPEYKFIICRSRKSGADVTGQEAQEPNLRCRGAPG